MLISVIIPFFGVERFIGRCVESLMNQSINDNIEFIFVDDASTDNSRRIIEQTIAKYPHRLAQSKIITHKHNKGLPAARNTGLSIAQGEYIAHVDSDDFVDDDMFARLLECAKQTNADYIWSDWFLSYEHHDRLMTQPHSNSPEEALKLMLSGKLKYNVWNKLVKRSLYIENSILFPEGHAMGEDMTMIRLLYNAKKVCYVKGAWYHYVKVNDTAMTVSYTSKTISDLKYNVAETVNAITNHPDCNLSEAIAEFKLSSKYHFLYSSNTQDYHTWTNLWPECNNYISTKNGIRSWLVQLAAKHHFWFLLKLHFAVYNSMYTFLFKSNH